MKPKILRTSLLVSLAMAALLVGGALYAQNRPAAQAGRGPAAGRGMMAQHQQMMAEMQAAEKTLDALVASMNAAKGADKVDRMAAVVTQMVAQHKQMRTHMMSMQGGMMQQMMPGMRAAPAGATGNPNAGSPEDDVEHHPEQP